MSADRHACRRLETLLDRELDGELTAEQRAFMDAHLGECASCRERRGFHGTVRRAIDAALRDDGVPTGMASRMLRQLDALQAEDEA